jgi:TonB-dependent SusC/RagA subfamily outer membrane receptor
VTPRVGRRTLKDLPQLLAVVALALGSCWVKPGSSQTVEPRYEPHATGAATIIYPDETALGALDIVDLIQWYVPGAMVSRCGNGTVEIALRGGFTSLSSATMECPVPSNPLLIVDGVKISNEDFSWNIRSLTPFRVERIEVLRDVASASVYGMRASNGVILVLTRRR